MAHQLRQLVLGALLGVFVGWLWLRRQAQEAAPPSTSHAPPGADERIVLPSWSDAPRPTAEAAVGGRIMLPNGKEAAPVSVALSGGEPDEAASPAADALPEVLAAEADTSIIEAAQTTSKTGADEPAEASPGDAQVTSEGYCVRCKEQRPMVNVRQYMTANKRPALKGECGVCGAGMFKFIKE